MGLQFGKAMEQDSDLSKELGEKALEGLSFIQQFKTALSEEFEQVQVGGSMGYTTLDMAWGFASVYADEELKILGNNKHYPEGFVLSTEEVDTFFYSNSYDEDDGNFGDSDEYEEGSDGDEGQGMDLDSPPSPRS